MNKYLKRSHIIITGILGLFILVYLFTRLYHLTQLPIFTDEALYIRWAQIALNDASWRFISLTDGKQPSFIWAALVSLRVFEDPLFAGRFVSVLAGLFSTIGMFFLGRELFNNSKIGLIAAATYVTYPMALVYDRLALYDSLVAMFAVWALYLHILLIRRLRLDIALILGVVLGGGVLTKTNAFFNIYLSPLLLLLLDWKIKNRNGRILKWLALVSVSAIFMYGMYSVLRLSPFFHVIAEKNALFVYPFSEWIQHPFSFFSGNIQVMIGWVQTYLTLPVIAVGAAGLLLKYKNHWREKVFLILWFVLPFIALALFGKVIYPRFVFFMTIPLLILFSYSLYTILCTIKSVYLKGLMVFFVFSWMAVADFHVVTDLSRAPIPQSDLNQYVNDWPAGNGVVQSVEFFRQEAEKEKIFIATEGTFGLLPHALEIHLIENPNIQIEGFWPVNAEMLSAINEKSRDQKTFVVFYQPCPDCKGVPGTAPETWPLRLIERYQQGIGNAYYAIYEVIPQ